jgi:Phage integrase family
VEHKASHLALTTVEQAIAAYMQEMRVCGRNPKTLQWHQTSLGALRRYLWRQFQLTDICSLTRACLQAWVTEMSIGLSVRTGATRTVSTAGSPGGQNAGMMARNHAILWLLRDTGLRVSELCGLRLADVDRASGTVTVRGKRGRPPTFHLSADGQRAVGVYLDLARLTPAWEPAVPEARDRLLLTERRHPLTKNSLTLLFLRLSQRAGFARESICPSMLRETYAIRFLLAGGELAALQEQLGVADLASVKRYQHFCEQRRQEQEIQACSEESVFTQQSRRDKSKRRKEQGRGRGRRRSS